MTNQTIQTIENIENNVSVPLHVFKWVNSQQSIIHKAHKITEKRSEYSISPIFTVVRK